LIYSATYSQMASSKLGEATADPTEHPVNIIGVFSSLMRSAKENVPKTVAEMSGGEYLPFHDEKTTGFRLMTSPSTTTESSKRSIWMKTSKQDFTANLDLDGFAGNVRHQRGHQNYTGAAVEGHLLRRCRCQISNENKRNRQAESTALPSCLHVTD
jgi:hypothetical protein